MSRIRPVLAALLLIPFAVPALTHEAEALGQNLLLNPGFESGMTSWVATGSCLTAETTTRWAWNAARSLYADQTCDLHTTTSMVAQDVAVAGSVTYHASVQLNVQKLGLDGPALGIIWFDAAGTELKRDMQPALILGVNPRTTQTTADSPPTAVKARVGLFLARGTSSAAYADDFDFRAGAPLKAPAAPSPLQAYGAPGYVSLSWAKPNTEPGGGGEPASYIVERRTLGVWHSLAVLPATDVINTKFFYDYSADNLTTYSYRVSAANRVGVGPTSNVAQAQATEFPAPMVVPLLNADFSRHTDGWNITDAHPSNNTCYVTNSSEWLGTPHLRVMNDSTLGYLSPCGVYQDVNPPSGNAATYILTVPENVVIWTPGVTGKLALAFYNSTGDLLLQIPVHPPGPGDDHTMTIIAQEPETTTKLRIISQNDLPLGGKYYAGPFKLIRRVGA